MHCNIHEEHRESASMCCPMGLQQDSFGTLYRAVRAGTPRAPAQQNFYDSVFSGKSAQEARAHLPNKTQLSLHAPDRQFFVVVQCCWVKASENSILFS